MKKLIILLLLLLLSLTACNTKVRDESAQTQSEKRQNSDVVLTEMESEISEPEESGVNVDATWDFSEIHGSEEDLFDGEIIYRYAPIYSTGGI